MNQRETYKWLIYKIGKHHEVYGLTFVVVMEF